MSTSTVEPTKIKTTTCNDEKTKENAGATGVMEDDTTELSVAQKVRMERNRQRALLLRSSRLTAHPYAPAVGTDGVTTGKKVHLGGTRMVDSGGGFFVDEEEQNEHVLTASDLPQEPGIKKETKVFIFLYKVKI